MADLVVHGHAARMLHHRRYRHCVGQSRLRVGSLSFLELGRNFSSCSSRASFSAAALTAFTLCFGQRRLFSTGNLGHRSGWATMIWYSQGSVQEAGRNLAVRESMLDFEMHVKTSLQPEDS